MRKRFSARPSLEVLEDRWAPATIAFINGLLQITGQTNTLTITQNANNSFQVQDGAGSILTFKGVSSIIASTPNGSSTVNVNLGALTYTGSLQLKTGNGNNTINLGLGAAAILGNVTILNGLGTQIENIGGNSSGTGGGFGALTIGGNLQIVNTGTPPGIGTGFTPPTPGDQAYFGNSNASLNVKGNVTLTGVNTIRLDNDVVQTFGGDFTASLGANTGFLYMDQEVFTAPGVPPTTTIAGNLSLTGGNDTDFFNFGALTIGKNVTMNYGNSPANSVQGGNFTAVTPLTPGVTRVNGNFTYTGGVSIDQMDLGGSIIGGNATLTLGSLLVGTNSPLQVNEWGWRLRLGLVTPRSSAAT